MGAKIHTYEGKSVTVTYNSERCIHAAECVRGLPRVFDPKARPWIQPDAAEKENLLEVIARCPSGALQAPTEGQATVKNDPNDVTSAANTIDITNDGPLRARGDLCLVGSDGATLSEDSEMYLCRCGKSADKPFCDGSHKGAGFADPGAITDPKIKGEVEVEVEGGGGGLRMTLAANGPLLLQGPVALSGTGSSCSGSRGALCRCGESANKPFCDGAHKAAGFEAP